MNSKFRVAVIDDAPDNAEILQVALEGEGYEVHCFYSGQAFLEKFRADAFDLILLDLAMPEISGFDVFDAIRADVTAISVVAVTANVYEADRMRAIDRGFAGFIKKPIMDLEKFLTYIGEHLAKSRAS